MNLFFTTDIRGDFAFLHDEEAKHCAQVLRKKPGDAIYLVDGRGGWYEGILDEVNKREVCVKIVSAQSQKGKRPASIHLAIAPTKNMDRFEWFLEKCTELGIDEITPLQCKHSERERLRPDRLEKILLAAMKQCLRAYLPTLNELIDFEAFIKRVATNKPALRFIAHCQADNLPHLKDNCPPGDDVIILIGPEGDFSKDEILLAEANGFRSISLGKARLRTETAGIAACHIANLANE